MFKQFATAGVFHNHSNVGICLDDLLQSDNVGVRKGLQDADFTHEFSALGCRVDAGLRRDGWAV